MLETDVMSPAGGEPAPAVFTPAAASTTGIAIMGSNPATRDQAPFDRSDWLIYSCSPDNSPHGHSPHTAPLPRVDQIFEVHTPLEDPTRPFAYLQWLAEQPHVWLRDPAALKLFRGGRLYPEKELRGTAAIQKVKGVLADGRAEVRHVEIPSNDGKFNPWMFTSSIAYMLAKAIDDCEKHGIPQIGLWGIMQNSDNEYTYQRPGIQYFIGEAMRRGIKVIANRESCLFDMPSWKW